MLWCSVVGIRLGRAQASYRAEYFGMLNNSGYENQKKYFIPKIIRTVPYRYQYCTVLSWPIFGELIFILNVIKRGYKCMLPKHTKLPQGKASRAQILPFFVCPVSLFEIFPFSYKLSYTSEKDWFFYRADFQFKNRILLLRPIFLDSLCGAMKWLFLINGERCCGFGNEEEY